MPSISAIIPVLRVASLERSVAWYRDTLGFDAEQHGDAGAVLRRDGVSLMLRSRAGTERRPALHDDWDVYITLADGALMAILESTRRRTPLVRGPEVMPDGPVEFELEDPDGHRLCFAETLSETKGIPRKP